MWGRSICTSWGFERVEKVVKVGENGSHGGMRHVLAL